MGQCVLEAPYFNMYFNQQNHPGLSRIPAPAGGPGTHIIHLCTVNGLLIRNGGVVSGQTEPQTLLKL